MDQNWMSAAINFGKRNIGRTAPNPFVGAIIVKNGRVIGRGTTAKGGRPHAETIALEQVSKEAEGATLYVSLEPCAHWGKTPPCVDAIIAAKLKRVVIGCLDPNPNVAGKSISKLQENGIEVIVLETSEAKAAHAAHSIRVTEKRPYLHGKIAISQNGFMGVSGKRVQISGQKAEHITHHLRTEHDAILVGRKTFETDSPRLTCRLEGMEALSPRRFVWGGGAAEGFTFIKGDAPKLLERLYENEVLSVLVEGGGEVLKSLYAANVLDSVSVLISKTSLTEKDALKAPDFIFDVFEEKGGFIKTAAPLDLETDVLHHFVRI